jgi:hypothetical protein
MMLFEIDSEHGISGSHFSRCKLPSVAESIMHEAFDLEVMRYAGPNYPLTKDSIKVVDQLAEENEIKCFGGPHEGIVQFAFCDGSVKSISAELDLETLRRLANRADGEAVNDGSY